MTLKTSEIYIEKDNLFYKIAENECRIAKECKNSILYLLRKEYFRIQQEWEDKKKENPNAIKTKEDFLDLVKMEKEIYHILSKKPRTFTENGQEFINYVHDIPRHVFQNIIRQVISSFRSFFGLLKIGKKANIPKYQRENYDVISYSDQDFKIQYFQDGVGKIKFLKTNEIKLLTEEEQLNLRTVIVLTTKNINKNGKINQKSRYIVLEKGILSVNQIRIIPGYGRFKIEVVYSPEKQSLEFMRHEKIARKKIQKDEQIQSIKKEIKKLKKDVKTNKEVIQQKNKILHNLVHEIKGQNTFKVAKVKDRSIQKFKNQNKINFKRENDNILVLDSGVDNIFTMVVINKNSKELRSAKIKSTMFNDTSNFYPKIESAQKKLRFFFR